MRSESVFKWKTWMAGLVSLNRWADTQHQNLKYPCRHWHPLRHPLTHLWVGYTLVGLSQQLSNVMVGGPQCPYSWQKAMLRNTVMWSIGGWAHGVCAARARSRLLLGVGYSSGRLVALVVTVALLDSQLGPQSRPGHG